MMPVSLVGYQRAWLRQDILAGLTLAAVAIPETMGYASMAQMPVITCAMVPDRQAPSRRTGRGHDEAMWALE